MPAKVAQRAAGLGLEVAWAVEVEEVRQGYRGARFRAVSRVGPDGIAETSVLAQGVQPLVKLFHSHSRDVMERLRAWEEGAGPAAARLRHSTAAKAALRASKRTGVLALPAKERGFLPPAADHLGLSASAPSTIAARLTGLRVMVTQALASLAHKAPVEKHAEISRLLGLFRAECKKGEEGIFVLRKAKHKISASIDSDKVKAAEGSVGAATTVLSRLLQALSAADPDASGPPPDPALLLDLNTLLKDLGLPAAEEREAPMDAEEAAEEAVEEAPAALPRFLSFFSLDSLHLQPQRLASRKTAITALLSNPNLKLYHQRVPEWDRLRSRETVVLGASGEGEEGAAELRDLLVQAVAEAEPVERSQAVAFLAALPAFPMEGREPGPLTPSPTPPRRSASAGPSEPETSPPGRRLPSVSFSLNEDRVHFAQEAADQLVPRGGKATAVFYPPVGPRDRAWMGGDEEEKLTVGNASGTVPMAFAVLGTTDRSGLGLWRLRRTKLLRAEDRAAKSSRANVGVLHPSRRRATRGTEEARVELVFGPRRLDRAELSHLLAKLQAESLEDVAVVAYAEVLESAVLGGSVREWEQRAHEYLRGLVNAALQSPQPPDDLRFSFLRLCVTGAKTVAHQHPIEDCLNPLDPANGLLLFPGFAKGPWSPAPVPPTPSPLRLLRRAHQESQPVPATSPSPTSTAPQPGPSHSPLPGPSSAPPY